MAEFKSQLANKTSSGFCTLKVKLTYPGAPVLGIVTSRPDANGAVTYKKLNGNSVDDSAIGTAKLGI